MAIPDYQSIMLPLLRFAKDRKEHSLREATDSFQMSLIYPRQKENNFSQAEEDPYFMTV